ncbi:MAG: nucleotidyltransferase [Crenarchaeota archaeon]|nr:nucleotidyltransferase [Thermoproteota archaeon]
MKEVSEEIKRIASAIRKRLPDAKILLFGSRARGDYLRSSDIDLIIVSSRFRGIHFTDRASLILKILWESDTLPRTGIDLLCYTPEEFEKKSKEISIVREALKHGIEL